MTPHQTSVASETPQLVGNHATSAFFESSHDRSMWAVLAAAKDAQQFCQSWLAIQCRLIPSVEGSLVLLLIEADGSYAPAAVWPDVRRDMSYEQTGEPAGDTGSEHVSGSIHDGQRILRSVAAVVKANPRARSPRPFGRLRVNGAAMR